MLRRLPKGACRRLPFALFKRMPRSKEDVVHWLSRNRCRTPRTPQRNGRASSALNLLERARTASERSKNMNCEMSNCEMRDCDRYGVCIRKLIYTLEDAGVAHVGTDEY